MSIYLLNWGTTIDWEGMACDERLGEYYTSLEDWAWPDATVITDQQQIASYREDVQRQVVEWYTEMEEPLRPTFWHFKGWKEPIKPNQKRWGVYELLETETIEDKAFKVQEPIAVIVIVEAAPWVKP